MTESRPRNVGVLLENAARLVEEPGDLRTARALLFATTEALRGTKHSRVLDQTLRSLDRLAKQGVEPAPNKLRAIFEPLVAHLQQPVVDEGHAAEEARRRSAVQAVVLLVRLVGEGRLAAAEARTLSAELDWRAIGGRTRAWLAREALAAFGWPANGEPWVDQEHLNQLVRAIDDEDSSKEQDRGPWWPSIDDAESPSWLGSHEVCRCAMKGRAGEFLGSRVDVVHRFFFDGMGRWEFVLFSSNRGETVYVEGYPDAPKPGFDFVAESPGAMFHFLDWLELDRADIYWVNDVLEAADWPTFELWRSDDNGHRFLVSEHSSRRAAERLASEFESRGHKQTYWVECRRESTGRDSMKDPE